MSKIKLGDKVRCKITGFVGIVVTRSEFLNGCVQYEVVPKVAKDNKVVEPVSIDEQSLEVITTKKKNVKKEVKKESGGAMRKEFEFRGF